MCRPATESSKKFSYVFLVKRISAAVIAWKWFYQFPQVGNKFNENLYEKRAAVETNFVIFCI